MRSGREKAAVDNEFRARPAFRLNIVDLVAQYQHFGLKPTLRLEPNNDPVQKQVQPSKHSGSEFSNNSLASGRQMEFSVRTAGKSMLSHLG